MPPQPRVQPDMNMPDRDHSVLSTADIAALVTPLADGSARQEYSLGPKIGNALHTGNEKPIVVITTRASLQKTLGHPSLGGLLKGHTREDKDHAGEHKLREPVVPVAYKPARGIVKRVSFVDAGDTAKVTRDRSARFRDVGAAVGPLLYPEEGDDKGGMIVIPDELWGDQEFLMGLSQGIGNRSATTTKAVLAKVNKAKKAAKGIIDVSKVTAIRRRLESLGVLNEKTTEDDEWGALLCLKQGEAVARAKALARFLMELPANVLTTHAFVKTAQSIVDTLNAKYGDKLEMQIVGPEGDPLNNTQHTIQSLEAGLMIAIHQGSTMPGPYFVRIKYRPGIVYADDVKRKVNRMIAKTMIFDDGGRANKGEAAKNMKSDMGAGATNLGAMVALVEGDYKNDMDFCFGICANENGEHARRMDDLLRAASGKTVEEGHTDAEGREDVADAVYISRKFIADDGDDVGKTLTDATLTGSAVRATGHRIPVIGYDADKAHALGKAMGNFGERGESLVADETDIKAMQGKTGDANNLGENKEKRGAAKGFAFIHDVGDTPEAELDEVLHLDIASATVKETPGHSKDLEKHELSGGEGVGAVLAWATYVA